MMEVWRWSGQKSGRERGAEINWLWVMNNDRQKQLKDNFIRLSHRAVASAVAQPQRSKCKRVCVSPLTRQKGPRGKQPCHAWSSDEGGTCSGANLVCMLMMLSLHENFLCMQSTSAPQQKKYNNLHIAFLHIVSPECHLALQNILKIYAGESHSQEGSMLFIDFFSLPLRQD